MQGLPHAPCRLQLDGNAAPTQPLTLCLHTLRADCNVSNEAPVAGSSTLCLHTLRADCNGQRALSAFFVPLCLHTLRADCNDIETGNPYGSTLCLHTPRADCNSNDAPVAGSSTLCLHTPRADCNGVLLITYKHTSSLPPHAPCRLQRQKCTELQYALFRTCVELVDSFSVLNKSMLR